MTNRIDSEPASKTTHIETKTMNMRPNLPPTSELQAVDAKHHLHPFTNTKELNAEGTRIITHAQGVFVWDSDGNQILDGMAGLWCVNIGYGRTEIAEAVYRQLQQLPYYNTFFQSAHPPVIELSERLARLAPGDLNHVFFSSSGSEANDTVVRMVRHYWTSMGHPTKKTIISRTNAYHGSTMAAASLGGMQPMHDQGGLPIPDITHIAQPYWFHEGGDLSPDEFGIACAQALETEIDRLGEQNVAAFIAEPIQGAGGVIVPPESYWPEISRICRERNILLVADEVICGFGRTGHWFGSQHFGFKPDLMTIAKGLSSGYLPLGGVMVNDHFAEGLIDSGGEFNHGYTYSAHPASCAAANANLAILEDEDIVKRVGAKTGPYLQRLWATLADHPLVGEARMVGLMGGVDLVKDKTGPILFPEPGTVGKICRDHCINNGLVMRPIKDIMVVCPPLVISEEECDLLVERARKSLDHTLDTLRRKDLF